MGAAERVIVIGLDGGTFRLLQPWAREGRLPTLARIMEEGTWGTLRTTVRPESSVAWTSFMTGVNPGKHGIFGFARWKGRGYSYGINDSRNIGAPTLWHILSEQGKRVGVLNVPMTYPPSPVKGFLVSGMMTPSLQSPFTFPDDLAQRLLASVGDYVISVDGLGRSAEELLARLNYCTQRRKEALLYLMEEYEWDLLVAVFIAPDRIQHFLWAEMDPHHPRHDPQADDLSEDILKCYAQLDEIIGSLLDVVDDRTLLFIVSDHGFNGFHKMVNLNAWLEAQNLLAFRSRLKGRAAPIFFRLRSLPGLRRIKGALPLVGRADLSRSFLPSLEDSVDWAETKAFFSPEGGIRINLKNREPQGIVEAGSEYEALRGEITEGLLNLRDSETGFPVIDSVYRREDLYRGPYLECAPDLIAEPLRHEEDPGGNFALSSAPIGPLFDAQTPYTGNHTLDGIFLAWGKGLRHGPLQGVQIIDLAPTILHALGLSIPRHMDGEVLDIFEGKERDPHYVEDFTPLGEKESAISPEDEETIRRRLAGLGYLG